MPDETNQIERVKEQLSDLKGNFGVLGNKIENLSSQVVEGLKRVDDSIRDITARYATKEDVKSVSDDVRDIRSNITKGVWIVITAVIMATLAAAFKTGFLHAG